MPVVSMHCDEISVALERGPAIRNISGALQQIVEDSEIVTGTGHLTVIGSTGSITTIEYEPGVVEDLKQAIARMAPPGMEYAHEKAWHDGNGHSHVQAALLGPSLVVPIRGGRMDLGTWQQVVVINHDNRARTRRVQVTILGTRADDRG